jgi:diguanylate cyclase (GGDEF)-like protein
MIAPQSDSTLAGDDIRLAALERYDILDTPPEPAFDRIANLVRLTLSIETGLVSFIDAHRQWYKAADGVGVKEVPIGDTLCQHTLATGDPLVFEDVLAHPRFARIGEVNGVRFYVGIPLVTADRQVLGTLCAIDSQPRRLEPRELDILKHLAAVVMDQLELRRLATIDPLTGIATRRAFREDADRFVALARRHRSQLSAIVFDIDRFKSVNDTYGHAAGDAVLKAVATAAQSSMRQTDLLARLGGEEFAIILPDADQAAAMAVAEKLRHALLELKFAGSRPPLTVSASFGVVVLDPGADDLDSLLVKADEALYEAKASGRNVSIPWRGTTVATTRQVERRRVLKAGRLVFNASSSTIDCTVRTLWETGAEVKVTSSSGIPDEVTLELRSSGFKWPAKVTVRRPDSIELAFAA